MTGRAVIYAAGACTLIAGVLHIFLSSNVIGFSVQIAIFFLIAGIAQIFWNLPVVRSWGKAWNYIGIGGTIILIALWAITRYPDNPITCRALPVDSIGITIEFFQIVFIILSIIIVAKGRSVHELDVTTNRKTNDIELYLIHYTIILIPVTSSYSH